MTPDRARRMDGMLHIVRRAGGATLDLLLPPHCLTCDTPVGAPGRFCPECFAAMNFLSEPCCARCGVPFGHAAQPDPNGLCPACLADPPRYGSARGAFRYDAQSKRIILPLKYGDRVDLAAALAPHMARAGSALLRRAELLVPVPLHRRRLFARRYNQAALLARALARLSGRPALADALARTRRTAALEDRSAAERAEELDGAVAVRPHCIPRIAGRHVLLIDDVLTSGATANACAAALLAAGAAGVDVLVAARVPDRQLG